MADHTIELLFVAWAWGVIGSRLAIARGHFTLPRLAIGALLWPLCIWIALCDRVDRDRLPGERP